MVHRVRATRADLGAACIRGMPHAPKQLQADLVFEMKAVSPAALAVSTLTFTALTALFPDSRPQIHQLAAIVPAGFVNCLLTSAWTFREHSR